MNDDGTMARVPDLVKFCEQHGLKMVTVADLIRYRLQNERYIHRIAESLMPTPHGDFRVIAYESEVEGRRIARRPGLWRCQRSDETIPSLVRVHTHCLAGDVFGTTLCDCRAVVENSLKMIAEAGRGALVYLHNGSAGFGIDRSVDSAPRRLPPRPPIARPQRRSRPAYPSAGGPRRPDPLRSRNPQDSPAHQHAHPRSRPSGLRHRDRRAGPGLDPGGNTLGS